MKRNAILLRNYLNFHEEQQTEKDFAVVKTYLQSANGGCFQESEILTDFNSKSNSKSCLLNIIKSNDFSFIYFTGHSCFNENKIELPLWENETIKEDELIYAQTKEWIFLDCCRTVSMPEKIPEFNIERKNSFKKAESFYLQKWEDVVTNIGFGHCVCYSTKIGKPAFANEFGGLGTQLFFSELGKSQSNIMLKPFLNKISVLEINGQKFDFTIDQQMIAYPLFLI